MNPPAHPLIVVWTDRTLLTPNWTLAQAVAPAITGGAGMVVFDETDLPAGPRLTVARFLVDGIKGRVPLIVRGSPEFTIKGGAQGVLVERPEEVAEARRILGPDATIGLLISIPNHASTPGVDLLIAHLDWTAPEAALSAVQELCRSATAPLYAGIDMEPQAAQLALQAGASGIVLCRPAMASYDRTEAIAAYLG